MALDARSRSASRPSQPNLPVATVAQSPLAQQGISTKLRRVTQADEKAALTVVVVGQGYVGLPVAMRAVEAGFNVIGFDVSEPKVAGLRAGKTHIDDISDDHVATALATGRFQPTSS